MEPVIIRDIKDRETIVREFVLKLRALGYLAIAVSMSRTHLHALVEAPYELKETKKVIGQCKQACSLRISIEGRVWGEGGKFEVARDKEHLHNSYHYIREKQDSGTVVWSHNIDENWIDLDVPVKAMK